MSAGPLFLRGMVIGALIGAVMWAGLIIGVSRL